MPKNNRGFVSAAWRFFDKVMRDGQTVAVVCKLCEKQYKFFGNTSNLRAHLMRGHPIQWELSNNGMLDEDTLTKNAYNSKTDFDQSETENEHNDADDDQTRVASIHLIQDMASQSHEEWLDEDTGNLATLKTVKKAKRRKIKREVLTPPRNIFSFPNSMNERVKEIPSKDEYSVFGEYIANKLRKFQKPRTRGNIQQLITTILWQAEYGVYDCADSVKRILMHSVEPEPQVREHVMDVSHMTETVANEQNETAESNPFSQV